MGSIRHEHRHGGRGLFIGMHECAAMRQIDRDILLEIERRD